MVLEIPYFVREQEAVRHEFIINWEESLESTDNYAKNILFCKMVHQWIPVENALPHFDYVEVVISQGHAVPEQAAIARLVGFPVPILANDILNCVKLTSAVIGINNNLLSPQYLLFSSIHQVVLVHSVFRSLIIACLLLVLGLLARSASREHSASVEVCVAVRLLLLVTSCKLVGSLVAHDHIGPVLLLLKVVRVVMRVLLDRSNWARYLIGLGRIYYLLLLILINLARYLLISLSLIASLCNFSVSAVSALVHLLHLVLILLQGCLVIIDYYLFFGTSVTVSS